jgi:hypothetical protein
MGVIADGLRSQIVIKEQLFPLPKESSEFLVATAVSGTYRTA